MVGAFSDGMESLRRFGLIEALQKNFCLSGVTDSKSAKF
jgi:hypothetical protein